MLHNLKLSNSYLNSLYYVSKPVTGLIQEMPQAFASFLCYKSAYVKYSFVFPPLEHADVQYIHS